MNQLHRSFANRGFIATLAVLGMLEVSATSECTAQTNVVARTKLQQDAGARIEQSMRTLHEAIAADELEAKQEALRAVLPTERDLITLFGDERGAKAWRLIGPQLENMIKNADAVSQEFASAGELKSLEARDLRAESRNANEPIAILLAALPADIPAFALTINYERRTSGSSTYVIVNDRVVWVRSLERLYLATGEAER